MGSSDRATVPQRSATVPERWALDCSSVPHPLGAERWNGAARPAPALAAPIRLGWLAMGPSRRQGALGASRIALFDNFPKPIKSVVLNPPTNHSANEGKLR